MGLDVDVSSLLSWSSWPSSIIVVVELIEEVDEATECDERCNALRVVDDDSGVAGGGMRALTCFTSFLTEDAWKEWDPTKEVEFTNAGRLGEFWNSVFERRCSRGEATSIGGGLRACACWLLILSHD